ncbi:hypothetical protein IMZ48_33410 [Candidatus Bathyarchaeota archaeon]|nr:hypothetical protein [Candidatus Bathyarchaeota archaeon]
MEDKPTDPGASQAVVPESDPLPPSDPNVQGQSNPTDPRTSRETRNNLRGDPTSARISTTHIHARTALAEGSLVRNRVMRNLRDILGNVPRDAEDGPQVPTDAPRVESPQEAMEPDRGRQRTRGHPLDGMYKWTWAESSPIFQLRPWGS